MSLSDNWDVWQVSWVCVINVHVKTICINGITGNKMDKTRYITQKQRLENSKQALGLNHIHTTKANKIHARMHHPLAAIEENHLRPNHTAMRYKTITVTEQQELILNESISTPQKDTHMYKHIQRAPNVSSKVRCNGSYICKTIKGCFQRPVQGHTFIVWLPIMPLQLWWRALERGALMKWGTGGKEIDRKKK